MLSSAHDQYDIIPAEVIQAAIDNLKSPGGRPHKYNATMPGKLVRLMAEGRTFKDAITIMGLSEPTAYSYIKQFLDEDQQVLNTNFKPEFFKSYKFGCMLSELWWNELGRLNLNNKEFNNTLYMMFRTNMHGWTRRLDGKLDITETKHTIETQQIKVDMNITLEEYKEYMDGLIQYGIVKPEQIQDGIIAELDAAKSTKAH